MKDYYAILGVTPTATLEEIEAAYRQKAKQYHPDKVSHLGPEFRELAERRMKEINEAYEALIKLLGGNQYRRTKQSTSEQHEKTTESKTAPGTPQDVKTSEAEVATKTRFRKSTIILMLLVILAGFLAVLSLNRVENLAQQLSASTFQNQKLAGKVSALEQTRASPSISQQIDNLANEVRKLAQKVSVLERTPRQEQARIGRGIVGSRQVQPNQQIDNIVLRKLTQRVIALEQAQQELKKTREQEKRQLPIPTAKRIQTIKNQVTPVDIGDGLLLSNAYFTLEERRGNKYPKLIGQITNNSQQHYYSPEFEIRFYDSNGQFLMGSTFQLGGTFDTHELPRKKTRSFEVLLPANTNIGEYEIQLIE